MKINKRFNFTDIIIILALVAIICGFLFRTPIEKLIEEAFFRTEVTYVVQPDTDAALNFTVGEELFDINGVSLGTVSKIDFSTEDTAVISRITVITLGITDNSGTYIADKMFIAPGVNIHFRSNEGLACFGTVKIVKTDSIE